jgi:hypothetical protein
MIGLSHFSGWRAGWMYESTVGWACEIGFIFNQMVNTKPNF